jgi:hypothetical protein
MKKVRNLSIEEYTKKATEKREVFIWGDKYEFEPYLCENKLGDGLQLVAIGSVNNRPYYWLVLIDSNADVASDFDYDDIVELIEDECGRCNENYCEECDNNNTSTCEYPIICWGGGYRTCIANFKTGFENPYFDYL